LLFALALGWVAPAPADTFLLKDGSTLEGVAVEEGETLVLTTYDGRVVRLPKAEVVGVRKDPRKNEYYAQAAKVPAADAKAHYELGLWCQKNRLAAEAEREFKLALRADPTHEGAGKALGYELRDGQRTPAKAPEIAKVAPPPARSDEAGLLAEARQWAERLKALGKESFEKHEAGQAILAHARAKPEVFGRILRTPNYPGSACIHDAAVRGRAAEVLGLAGDRRAMQDLLDSCLQDPEISVRAGAAQALPRLEEPVALRKLVDLAISPQYAWAGRRLAIEALRRYGDKEAVERMLGELSFELAGGQLLDPLNPLRSQPPEPVVIHPTILPPVRVVDVPPHGGTPEFNRLYPVLAAFKELTGASFTTGEKDFKTWKEWWEQNREKFQFKE
jgi:hypothetical protein